MLGLPMNGLLKRQVMPYLVPALKKQLSELSDGIKNQILEIRLRVRQPAMLVLNESDIWLSKQYVLSRSDMDQILQLLTRSSVYACEEELRQGYITIPGGHRVGLVGKAVLENGSIRTLKYIGGLNIRLARQMIGAADELLPHLIVKGSFVNTLLMSAPGGGKTTMLRDLVRQLSLGVPHLGLKGQKISVVDERSEIAACYRGEPQHDVGPRTDVLDGAKKAEGIILVLRAMSPQIVATDEVGSSEDIRALGEALVSGVQLLATVHGNRPDDLNSRQTLSALMDENLFRRVVILGKSGRPGTISAIYEGVGLRPLRINLNNREECIRGSEVTGSTISNLRHRPRRFYYRS